MMGEHNMIRPINRRGLNGTGIAKLAASAIVLGTTMVGCTMNGATAHPANVSDVRATKTAVVSARHAGEALAKRDYAKAVAFAETAVAAQPRDTGYRMLLGQAYLGAGRFQSAETSFADTLTLDPERDRAALNLALTQIAQGKPDAAKATLHDYRDKLAAADYGLALALAGDPDEAVRVLEVASRTTSANAKTRQNLALAYALQGKWANAKVMAVQDLTPDAADARIAEWASLARPGGASEQVLAILGVKRAFDTGQPSRLALAAPAKAIETAMLAQPPVPASQPAPIPSDPVPPPMAAPEAAVFETAVTATVASRAEVSAPLIHADRTPVKSVQKSTRALPTLRQAALLRPAPGGKFVVQIGAFSNAAVAERAWNRASAKFDLSRYDAVNGSVQVRNASLVRVSIGGFSERGGAAAMCARIKQTGASCFVRLQSGDAPARWVQKHTYRVASR